MPKSVAGDRLSVKIIHENRDLIRAEILEIIQPAAQRIKAPCPYFASCGGCSLQQLEENAYREFKQKIVDNAIKQAGFTYANTEINFLPPASRRRAEFKILNKNSKYHLAYLTGRSHDKTPIDNCIILEPTLQKLLHNLNHELNDLQFIHLTEAINLTGIDDKAEAIFTIKPDKGLDPAIIRSALQILTKKLNLSRAAAMTSEGKQIAIAENYRFTMNIGGVEIPLPYNSFLQATKEGQQALSDFVLQEANNARRILDLFCGIGTYSILLAKNSTVVAADNHDLMINSLKAASKAYELNLTAINRDLFSNPFSAEELKGFDTVVINPPRLGAKAQCEAIAESTIRNLVMVSCNPATFARDAKILKNSGFELQKAIAIDQFVFSPHLELAASFTR